LISLSLKLPESFISLFLQSPSTIYGFISFKLSARIHQLGGNKERG
jgi:hypothetical protein